MAFVHCYVFFAYNDFMDTISHEMHTDMMEGKGRLSGDVEGYNKHWDSAGLVCT
jgi:hypothetical protein